MKKLVQKTKGLVRGTSTAVLLSVVIHATLFFAAGVWVVFKIIDAQEVKFVPPPPVERPKMRLKKLRVKVKPTAKPRKTTQRITSARKTAAMPDIQLPEMGNIGAGLSSVGGFEMMTDMAMMTIMGAGKSVGNDLEGTFYDLKYHRDGSPVPGMAVSDSGWDPLPMQDAINLFLANDWSPSTLAKYYRAPHKLYATQLMVPPCASSVAPAKFGIDEETEAAMWAIHYKGKIAHKTGGKFRFVGHGDDLFYVRLNGRIVLKASHGDRLGYKDPENWKSSSREHKTRVLGIARARIGDWFTMEPGVPVEMEALIAEVPGGIFDMMLLVEEFGVEYPENEQGDPILPIFKTMETPQHLIDEIEYTLIPGQATLEGGPVFNAY